MRLSLLWINSTRSRTIFTPFRCDFRAFRTQFSHDFHAGFALFWQGFIAVFTQFSPYSSARTTRIERIEARWMTGRCWRGPYGNRSIPGPDFSRPPNAGELVFLGFSSSDLKSFRTHGKTELFPELPRRIAGKKLYKVLIFSTTAEGGAAWVIDKEC